jgi:hypothetical protein
MAKLWDVSYNNFSEKINKLIEYLGNEINFKSRLNEKKLKIKNYSIL